VPIVPFFLLSELFDRPTGRALHLSWSALGALAYLGWFATIAAYALWTGLLKRHPASKVAPFSLGVPLVGIGAGMVALGDVITLWQWVGIGFVLGAMAMAILYNRRAIVPGHKI
jgi:O-acetylserine/cysteine efflux transporter